MKSVADYRRHVEEYQALLIVFQQVLLKPHPDPDRSRSRMSERAPNLRVDTGMLAAPVWRAAAPAFSFRVRGWTDRWLIQVQLTTFGQ